VRNKVLFSSMSDFWRCLCALQAVTDSILLKLGHTWRYRKIAQDGSKITVEPGWILGQVNTGSDERFFAHGITISGIQASFVCMLADF
jgi:hypothetical protein